MWEYQKCTEVTWLTMEADTKSIHFIWRLVDEDSIILTTDIANEVKEVFNINVFATIIKHTLNKIYLHG